MGSAFVETTKPEIAKDEPLSSSLRVVRAGLPAPHPTGLWLTGQSLSSFAYVTMTPTSECDQGLLRAVVETLASHPGVSWASSGNRTLKAREDREQWLAAVSRLCATSTEIR